MRKVATQAEHLPFDFYEEEKKQFEDSVKHFPDPKTDDEKLREFQYQYIICGSTKALESFYNLLTKVGLKMINGFSRTNRDIKKLTMEERKEKAHEAATYMVEQLLTRPRFQFAPTPTSYLFSQCFKKCVYKNKETEMQDFVDFDKFFKVGTDEEACIAPEPDKITVCKNCVYFGLFADGPKCLVTMDCTEPSKNAEDCKTYQET